MQLQSIGHKSDREHGWESVFAVLPAAALAAGILCCFMTGFHLTPGKGGILGGGLKSGMIFLWNEAADFLGNSRFLMLQQYQGSGEGCGLFLLSLWLLLFLVSYGFVRSGKWQVFLIYLIPFFAAQILWDIRPQPWAAGLFFWAILTSAVCCRLSGSTKLLAALLLLFLTGGVAAGVTLFTAEKEAASQAAESLSAKLHRSLWDLRCGTNPRGDGSLSPKDFDSQETALEVTMEEPESLYLRGFVGSNYKEGRWEPLAYSRYYEENPLFYWLHREGFSGLSQMEQVSRLLGKEAEQGSIRVNNLAASRNYIYAPYEMGQERVAGAKSWSDSFLTAGGIRGASRYELETLPNMVKEWPSLAAELFTGKAGRELSQYRTNESHYNVQIYRDYSEVTEQQRKLLAEHIGRSGNQEKGHVDYKEAISAVQTWLEENFIYTERVDENEDPVEAFFRSKKGCDVHYASAAVLMFRYYGIPARYAEGYLITPQDAEGKEPGDTISIPASNNHAWPEIYIDSFGWVPLEVTPEYYQRMEQPDLSKGLENQTVSDARQEYDRQKSSQYVEIEPESRPEDESLVWKTILLLAIFDLLILALAYVLTRLIQRWLAERKRRRAFRNPDVREAVCAIYAYMGDLGVPWTEEARSIGNRAAYSLRSIEEEHREHMLREWERMKRNRHENRKKRKILHKRKRTGSASGPAADGSHGSHGRLRGKRRAGTGGYTG